MGLEWVAVLAFILGIVSVVVGSMALAQNKRGPKGAKGDKGDEGAEGLRGLQGDMGPAGAKGADGASGTNGTNGTNGADGKDASIAFATDSTIVVADGMLYHPTPNYLNPYSLIGANPVCGQTTVNAMTIDTAVLAPHGFGVTALVAGSYLFKVSGQAQFSGVAGTLTVAIVRGFDAPANMSPFGTTPDAAFLTVTQTSGTASFSGGIITTLTENESFSIKIVCTDIAMSVLPHVIWTVQKVA